MLHRAVFLDRDGVLVTDRGVLTRADQFEILPGVPESLVRLKHAGFKLIVVTNQAVVARGLLSEPELEMLHTALNQHLKTLGAPDLDAVYACPHHPNATDPRYRLSCECRKPQPGMILRAIHEHGIHAPKSFLIGDRLSDVTAGVRSGCKTIWLTSGQHLAPPIESGHPGDASFPAVKPDFTCSTWPVATDWILSPP
jgi:D-glycero-D-manno-heptose 1,7-bisphosphate phosphatase